MELNQIHVQSIFAQGERMATVNFIAAFNVEMLTSGGVQSGTLQPFVGGAANA